jgi:hypothetical protein
MNESERQIKWMYNIKLTNSIDVMNSHSKHHVKNSHLHLGTISDQEMTSNVYQNPTEHNPLVLRGLQHLEKVSF